MGAIRMMVQRQCCSSSICISVDLLRQTALLSRSYGMLPALPTAASGVKIRRFSGIRRSHDLLIELDGVENYIGLRQLTVRLTMFFRLALTPCVVRTASGLADSHSPQKMNGHHLTKWRRRLAGHDAFAFLFSDAVPISPELHSVHDLSLEIPSKVQSQKLELKIPEIMYHASLPDTPIAINALNHFSCICSRL